MRKPRIPRSLWSGLWELESGATWPPVSESDAERFIRRVAAEEMLALLEASNEVPPNILARLQGHRALLRLQQRRSERLHQVTMDLCSKLSDEPWILLKGADYRYTLYDSPDLRGMRDIDLLVPFSGMEVVGRALERQNLERIFPGGSITRAARHHEWSYVGADFAVDLHHAFVQPSRHSVDYENIFREREQFRVGTVTAWHLSPVHAIVAHCLMMARDEYVVALRSYVDLWLLVDLHRDRIVEASELAKHWRCKRAFYSSLQLLGQVFPESQEIIRDATARVLNPQTRWYLDRLVLPDARRAYRQKRISRVWRKLNLLDTPVHLARFAADYVGSAVAGWRLQRKGRIDTIPSHE